MPSQERLEWIRSRLLTGTPASCHSSFNVSTATYKVTVRLHHGQPTAFPNVLVMSMLDQLDGMQSSYIVSDKGHRNSKNDSEVIFYLRSLSPAKELATGSDDVMVDAGTEGCHFEATGPWMPLPSEQSGEQLRTFERAVDVPTQNMGCTSAAKGDSTRLAAEAQELRQALAQASRTISTLERGFELMQSTLQTQIAELMSDRSDMQEELRRVLAAFAAHPPG